MISIQIDDRELRAYLNRLARRLDDMEPVMSSIGQELETRVSGRFETETNPSGSSWEPWASSTLENYPADGNARILDRYSDMLNSLNWVADSSSVRIGFGQAYAVYHEFGTKFMPRRGLLFDDPDAGTMGEEDLEAVLDIIESWLEEV